MITWNTTNDARSCYMASYQGASGADNSRNRRFPRIHPEAKPGSAPLETTTTKWFQRSDIPYKTPLHVLAITQEPFLVTKQMGVLIQTDMVLKTDILPRKVVVIQFVDGRTEVN